MMTHQNVAVHAKYRHLVVMWSLGADLPSACNTSSSHDVATGMMHVTYNLTLPPYAAVTGNVSSLTVGTDLRLHAVGHRQTLSESQQHKIIANKLNASLPAYFLGLSHTDMLKSEQLSHHCGQA